MSHSTKNLRQFRIRRQLSNIPEKQLKMVEKFIEFLQHRSNFSATMPVKLAGIWKNKGFERIENLEKSLKKIRKDLAESIINRSL